MSITRFCNDWTQSRNATWIKTLRSKVDRRLIAGKLQENMLNIYIIMHRIKFLYRFVKNAKFYSAIVFLSPYR